MDTAVVAAIGSQGRDLGFNLFTIQSVQAMVLAVQSGEVPLPFDQYVAEKYLVSGDFLQALDLLMQFSHYNNFLARCRDYAGRNGMLFDIHIP